MDFGFRGDRFRAVMNDMVEKVRALGPLRSQPSRRGLRRGGGA